MMRLRTAFAALLIAAASCLPLPAAATSFTTDQSDAWSVASESGWGLLTFQRGSVIFAAIFVYDQTRTPIWYSVTLAYLGNFVWQGDLYQTSGPWFGTVPFDPASVTYRKVGSATWTGTTVTSGQLQYDVDGVVVIKNPSRVFVVNDDFSGHYAGGLHETISGCGSLNGIREDIGILNIAQNGQAITLTTAPSGGGTCAYAGSLTQAGQMGAVVGSYQCSDGDAGSFQIFEMQVNPIAVTGRFTAASTTNTGCQFNGYFGGMRVTTF